MSIKPVIFIPGIEATALVNKNKFDFPYVWNAYDTLSTSIRTKVLDAYIDEKLQLNPLYDENINSIVERNHIARLPYEKSIMNLGTKIGENPVYLFGYDWRLSNLENGRNLSDFLDYLSEKLAPRKPISFRVLTHSMGGLVFLGYLQSVKEKKNKGDHNIDKVVFCAPPFYGSPYALVHLIVGHGGFKSFLNKVFGRDEDVRKVIRTYPSLFELLPWYRNALKGKNSRKNYSLLKKEHWQSNIYDDIVKLFEERLQQLAAFRNRMRQIQTDLSGLHSNNMIVIAGTGDNTVTYLEIDDAAAYPKMKVELEEVDDKFMGDGTVPYVSSTACSAFIKTYVVPKAKIFTEPIEQLDYHGMFLRDSRVQNIYTRFLTGKTNGSNWYQSADNSVIALRRNKA